MQRLTRRPARRFREERGAAAVLLSLLMVPLLGFASLALPDTEADDLMASYAVSARAHPSGRSAAKGSNTRIFGPNGRSSSTNRS